jgi:hypothetical protein
MAEWQVIGFGVFGGLLSLLVLAARYGVSRRAVAAEARREARARRRRPPGARHRSDVSQKRDAA